MTQCNHRECNRIRKKNAELWRENKRLITALKRAKKRGDEREPTPDEIRALHHFNAAGLRVTLRHLRTWAATGNGPQPPYEVPGAWERWVAEEVTG